MMVSKVFIILLMIVCAVAATNKTKEMFEEQISMETMQKATDNLKVALEKNTGIKNKHSSVKTEHDDLKTKAESTEALLQKYNGDPKELNYTDRELLDKQKAQKRVGDCVVKGEKIEKEMKSMKDDYNDLEKRADELKQEKNALEKEIKDLNTSIDTLKKKIANMTDVEIPDVKKRIADHTAAYYTCIDKKSWNPSSVGTDLAYWNSHPTQYISGTVNINQNNFTIGMFINAPLNGEYQPIFKTNVSNSYNNLFNRSYNNDNYGIEMGVQNNVFIMKNANQSMSIPFVNGLVFIIILQSQTSSTYIINGKNMGGLTQNWSSAIGEVSFYYIKNGGIKDLSVIRRILNPEEIQKHEAYYSYKYFRSGEKLPANHPYREEVAYK